MNVMLGEICLLCTFCTKEHYVYESNSDNYRNSTYRKLMVHVMLVTIGIIHSYHALLLKLLLSYSLPRRVLTADCILQ